MIAKELRAVFGHEGQCSGFYIITINVAGGMVCSIGASTGIVSRFKTRRVYHGIHIAHLPVTATMVPRMIPRSPRWQNRTKVKLRATLTIPAISTDKANARTFPIASRIARPTALLPPMTV